MGKNVLSSGFRGRKTSVRNVRGEYVQEGMSGSPIDSSKQQEAQLMLTNPRDALRGQSRSPNIVPFHMLSTVSYCAIVILSLSLEQPSASIDANDYYCAVSYEYLLQHNSEIL